jgi:DnaJ-class molecular chaperone
MFLYLNVAKWIMKKAFSAVRKYEQRGTQRKLCKSCGGFATKDVLFEIGNGLTLVERYCDQCAGAATKSI